MNITKLEILLEGSKLVDIAFSIQSSLALVGQSGSGKSLTLKALLGMLPEAMECSLQYDGDFTLEAGKTLSFVPQNPFTALSPLTKIHKQFLLGTHKQKELFSLVGLDHELLDRFAPELSGGQLQRVVIAMALESSPKLILLDEPTTALDPDTRVKILELLQELQKKMGFKILFVTHDMNAASTLCEDICVLKDGLLVENGKMSDVVSSPKCEYTQTLIQAHFANRHFRK